jgi:hypothetical protein
MTNRSPLPASTAIFIIDGKSSRFALAPGEGSELVRTAPGPIKVGIKGVVQLTAPDGSSAQGKF